MSEYIKLTEAPTLTYRSPLCSACSVELEDEDGWVCPVCGTLWSYDASNDDAGELYESWSGEKLDTEPVDDETAFNAGIKHERERRKKLFAGMGLSDSLVAVMTS